MRMRSRYLGVTLLVLAVVAAVTGRRLFHSGISSSAFSTTTVVPATQSYLVIFGVNDTDSVNWDGSITVAGATIQNLSGWRFSGTDAISGTTSWTMSTHYPPNQGHVQENGLIVQIPVPTGYATFTVTTTQGQFSFSTQDLPFGVSKSFLDGNVLVAQTGAQFQLTPLVQPTTFNEEEDFPSMAKSGDDVYLAYTQFVHGNRSKATKQTIPATIADFSDLARAAGGDQVFLLHYSVSTRTWTGPYAVTAVNQDVMRTAVAVDGQGRAWVFYSARSGQNFDLYAKTADAQGNMSGEIRVTSDAGTDLFPVAATDSLGHVWVAWQGFRNSHLEVLATAQTTGNTFAPETVISTSQASNWDPAIAAAPNGDVAISWDTYDKGDYDVYVSRVQLNGQSISSAKPIAIAATTKFEARSSLVYDLNNRLWIAYEVAGSRWGKNFGALDTSGLPLYSGHTIQVRCLIGNDVYTTVDDVAQVLPGAPADRLFAPSGQGPFSDQPDSTLAGKRKANGSIAPPDGPRNSFPRLATDPGGTVYLAFRSPAGSALSTSNATGGVSVGSIWVSSMVYFDGGKWHGPGVLGFTDAVSDNRPSIVALKTGDLLIAHSSDHRLSPLPILVTPQEPVPDGVNSDIFQSELVVQRTQQPQPQLQNIGQVTPDPPDPAVAAEVAAAKFSQNHQPTVNGQKLQLVRGDFHRHTEISWDGARDGPLIDAYRYSIDAAYLGWLGCCDHYNGEAREYTWWLTQKFSDAYLLGSQFIPMFYYERSIPYPEGHRNILFDTRGNRPLPQSPITTVNKAAPEDCSPPVSTPPTPAADTSMLYAYLATPGVGGISAPHTSATKQGTDWRNNNAVEPFVEIYQGDRQDYERPDAPRANTPGDSISGFECAGYVSNALGKGYKLGFEASSDHISTHISFTNVWVKVNPSRADILNAMRSRQLYGSTDNIVAEFSIGPSSGPTTFMGGEFTTHTTTLPPFTVKLWGTAPFKEVVVVKNNAVVYSTSGDRTLSFQWQDLNAQNKTTSYYYVRGLQTDGEIVWVSPIWVTIQP